ncbi:hypothetical protein CLOM_g217 [Closterium sp. NIES-68]|nr:hypothetical protein CLOM_g217 [Closterium sp. NIES-68]
MLSGGGHHAAGSSVSHLVDKACSEYLADPDWTTNLQLCDLLNASPSKAGDAMRAIHKKVTSRHAQVQLSALTLLETVMKNCGGVVHSQAVEKGVLADVAKIARKGGASPAATARARGLIQEWADVFPPGPTCRHTEYFLTYDELKRNGIPFPPRPSSHPHHSHSIPMPSPEYAAASHGVPPGVLPPHLQHPSQSTPPQLYNSPTYGSPMGGAAYNGSPAYSGAAYNGARSPLAAGGRSLPQQPQPPPLQYQQPQQQQQQQQQGGSGSQEGASAKPMSLADITMG